MDQSLRLFVLLLSQICFSASQNLEYHFIKESKTWAEAQTFCRKYYTDLATVRNMKDLERLRGTDGGIDGGTDVWIGLYQTSDDPLDVNRKWHWSQPEVKYNEGETDWEDGQPDDNGVPENCGMIYADNICHDAPCDQAHKFICYDESSSTTVMISDRRTWTQAQQFCREHYTDLISGLDQRRQFEVDYPTRSGYYWIGLSRDSWAWSDGSDSSFRNWNSDVNPLNKTCAALRAQGRWESVDCDLKKPFLCHGDLKIQKTLVKIRLSSAVDLNSLDPSILEQLYEHFRANNQTDVKLSWKRGKDGKIFQKQDGKKKKTNKSEL